MKGFLVVEKLKLILEVLNTRFYLFEVIKKTL